MELGLSAALLLQAQVQSMTGGDARSIFLLFWGLTHIGAENRSSAMLLQLSERSFRDQRQLDLDVIPGRHL